MIYVSADHHFFDKNYLKYNDRKVLGFNITNSLINKQNSDINKNDIVYYIGDLSSASEDKTINLVKYLNGNIFLLLGNHDNFKKRNYRYLNNFYVMDSTIFTLNYNSKIFNMFHYPLFEQPDYYNNAIHLHGHVHGKLKYNNKAIDVGYDNNDYKFLSLDYILKKVYE